MTSTSRVRTENRVATIERRQQAALSEQEETARMISENTVRLKALRLAREAKNLANGPAKKTRTKK